MDPEEKLVEAWLQLQGYFTISETAGSLEEGREVDLLAVRPDNSSIELKQVLEELGSPKRLHVEIICWTSEALGNIFKIEGKVPKNEEWGEAIENAVKKKFDNDIVKKFVKGRFGVEYCKLWVIQCKKFEKDPQKFKKYFSRHDVNFVPFEDVWKELRDLLKPYQKKGLRKEVLRFGQLWEIFYGKEDSKKKRTSPV